MVFHTRKKIKLTVMNPAKILIGICLLMIGQIAFGQHIYKIKTDSLLVTNDSCNAELNLENSTRNVNGFLYNKGNGRTEFRRGLIKLTDSTYQIGNDILNLGSYSSNNSWKTTGNNNITTNNFLGTLDSSKLIFKTNGIQHASIGVDGTINFEVNDTASKPAFRFYPNGDFVVKARRELAGNTFGPNSGIRYNAKYGILEVGTNNNFDTSRSAVCCGSLSKSAIIINSDFMNTITGDVHGSLVAGDNHVITSAIWSSVFGERHRMSGAGYVNKSMVFGYGQSITAEVNASIIGGNANSIGYPVNTVMNIGWLNTVADTSFASMVAGVLNTSGGNGQLVAGAGHTAKSPYGTFIGQRSVDFASLNYVGRGRKSTDSLEYLSNLDKYPIFSIGNSKYFANSGNPTKSNALTILYNGRTQINTTGFSNNLTESDVTPKAALEIVSNNSGILIPKLTTSQRDGISSVDRQNGLLLYNVDSSNFQYYNGTSWSSLVNTQAQIESPVVILKTLSVSNATSFDVDLTNYYTAYDRIDLEFSNVRPTTDNVSFQLYVSSDGVNFDNGTNNYKYSSNFSISNGAYGPHVSQGDTRINLGDMVGNTATGYFSGTLTLTDPDNSSVNPFIRIQIGYTSYQGDIITNVGWGKRLAAQATKKVRIQPTSGNISGTVKIIGYK